MRSAAQIEAALASGVFTDTRKPNTVVTVQEPWADIVGHPENVIFPQSDVGSQKGGFPIRWYQRADNSQDETEVPNVRSVEWNRGIGNDSASCSISIYNTTMYANGAAPVTEIEIGQHGYLTPMRGEDPIARARWGHVTNPWNQKLVPNAIIRTYQGYGGQGKTLAQAVTDGNLLQTGVWLIDEVSTGTDGMLEIRCRDMAKLLIDQMLFPPLVPRDHYPLKYFRYTFQDRQITATSGVYQEGGGVSIASTAGDKTTTYKDSSQDRWYGPNASIHGHTGTQSVDGIDTTYALSVGNSGPDKVFSTVWWEYETSGGMNAIYLHPWGGGYEMYVSIKEIPEGGTAANSEWQGAQTVPYDYSPLVGTQPRVVDTEAAIPYVAKFIIPEETSGEYVLPRVYNAFRVRVTFRHLKDSGIGPWRYRAGIREVKIRTTVGLGDIATTSATGQLVPPIFYAADYLVDQTDLNRAGYITVSNYGFIDVFGDCREKSPNRVDDNDIKQLLIDFIDAAGSDAAEVSSVTLTPDGSGYWVLYSRGLVRSFGSAVYYGEPYGLFNFETGAANGGINKAATIVSTNTGLGYWIITFAGEIFAYGDAPNYPNVVTIPGEIFHGAAAHPGKPGASEGLYLVASYGAVYTYGAAKYKGGYEETFNVSNAGQVEIAIDIEPTFDGGGYWILTSAGRVQPFGNAGDFGQMNEPVEHLSSFDRYYQLMSVPDSEGYLMLDGDGQIQQFGDTYNRYFGAPVPGTTGSLRSDGNYLDFSDIVKDLVLWSGFWLRGSVTNGEPDVYGNVETTGMFSEEHMPDEMFDKKPVIEALNELKESVGYIMWVDDEGGFRFESPNWWAPGNFMFDGTHTNDVWEIDERVNMTDYSFNYDDTALRSTIIIASEDPYSDGASTVYTEYVPSTATELRGLIKPAMWVNGFFQKRRDQEVMAGLIAMHVWFSRRIGSVSCAANPCIGINDQVRIFERTSSDTYLHYVREISMRHDLDSGQFTMNLGTNWLGSGDEWVIVTEPGTPGTFVVPGPVLGWMYNTPSPAINVAGYEIQPPQVTDPGQRDFGDSTFGSGDFGDWG